MTLKSVVLRKFQDYMPLYIRAAFRFPCRFCVGHFQGAPCISWGGTGQQSQGFRRVKNSLENKNEKTVFR